MPEVGAATRPWRQCPIAVLLLLARSRGPQNLPPAPRLLRDWIPDLDLLAGCRPEPDRSAVILRRQPTLYFVAECELQTCRGKSRAPRRDCRGAMPPGAHKSTRSNAAPELGGADPAFRFCLSANSNWTLPLGQGDACGRFPRSLGGGEGDRCQGCAGPQGRTLSEVQTR